MSLFVHDQILKPQKNKQPDVIVNYALYKVEVQVELNTREPSDRKQNWCCKKVLKDYKQN